MQTYQVVLILIAVFGAGGVAIIVLGMDSTD